jgi:hypothetical protein
MNAEFNLNHSFIATSLCVNRDKPMMHCNGKCFLQKQLDQQQDQQSNNQKTVQQIISVAFQIENEIHPGYFPGIITVQSSAFNMQLHKGFLKSCERPPTC